MKAERGVAYPRVVLTQPLNRHNCTTMDTRVRHAHNAGCDGEAFSTFKDNRGEFASAALTSGHMDSVRGELRKQRKAIERLSLGHNIDHLLPKYRLGREAWRDFPCYAGWFDTRVKVDGTVVPCCTGFLPLGNLRNGTFAEICNGPRYRAFRRQAVRPGGMVAFARDCDCAWCSYAADNFRIHRHVRWFGLFRG